MAKKTQKTEGEQGGEPPKQSEHQFTPPAKVKKLAKDLRGHKEDMDEIRGAMGGAVTDAVEHYFLHKKAFGDARKLLTMSAEKLNDYFRNRDYYEDCLGLRDLAKTAPRLGLGDSAPEKEAPKNGGAKTDEKPGKGSTVVGFPGAGEAGGQPH